VQVELTVVDPEVGTRGRFDLTLDHSDLVANCDELRLEQVLINLLSNALDAGAAQSGGDSRSGHQETSAPAPRIEIEIEAAEATLSISVHDNGPGIPDDVLPRLFEPFFTTKEMGQGLGLGLAISSSIARDAGGSLVARNASDGGALFVLTLRRARVQATDPLTTGH
jgi:two-component system C4-dicarboxylate transport sensor histidine kinase DctB